MSENRKTIQQIKIDELIEKNKYLALYITEQENIKKECDRNIEKFLAELELNNQLKQKYQNEERLEDNF